MSRNSGRQNVAIVQIVELGGKAVHKPSCGQHIVMSQRWSHDDSGTIRITTTTTRSSTQYPKHNCNEKKYRWCCDSTYVINDFVCAAPWQYGRSRLFIISELWSFCIEYISYISYRLYSYIFCETEMLLFYSPENSTGTPYLLLLYHSEFISWYVLIGSIGSTQKISFSMKYPTKCKSSWYRTHTSTLYVIFLYITIALDRL